MGDIKDNSQPEVSPEDKSPDIKGLPDNIGDGVTLDVHDDAGELEQFLTFTANEEEFAVDIMKVREIKGYTDVTRLPNTPVFMKGVINLRGVVIPIFDLKRYFNMGDTEAQKSNVFVIMAIGERYVGILVDAVSDIINVGKDHIQPAPKVDSNISPEFISGVISQESKMVVLLDIDYMFDHETIDNIHEKMNNM